jgi:hypothetical protein
MFRKILIGLAAFVLFLVAVGAYFYHKLQPSLRAYEARTAEEENLLQPRLVTGSGTFDKRVFYSGTGLGNISQIRLGWPADREGAEIALVASQGADFIDSSGQVKKRVRFAIEQRCPVAVARIDSAGEYGYLTRDESWAVPATLFDKDGRVRLSFDKTLQGIDDSVPANVSGDGKLSVVIGYNGGGGVALFDGDGKRLWKEDEGNVWHVETLDTNGDGREEILHTNARGQLVVRNSAGQVIAHYLPGSYVSQFVLTRWDAEKQPTHILVPTTQAREGCCKPMFLVLEANGNTVAQLESPLGDLLDRVESTSVHFGKGSEYFAVLKNNGPKKRSMLLLFDKKGQVAYQEILGESCLGVAPLPSKNGEQLLVGCTNKVWVYSPALPTNPQNSK